MMATVFRKSAKGQTEIETRANRLMPRLRTALILVDGRRDDDELRKLIAGEADATIRSLVDDGYIEVAEVTIDKPRPVVPPRPAEAAPKPVFNQKAFEQHRQSAVRVLNDMLGPLGEGAAVKIERCKTWEELMPALELAQRIVVNARGATAAADFGRQFIEAPPR
jgi:hypothetical protein